ncbi:MAG: cytochrome c oxidase assembly protein [Ardenticatenaceae bacterium]|nr:cytochrome c oxidase assembly protein [Ardenticatenaceae bacterium]
MSNKMDPILKAILLSWDWKIEVIVVLALAGTLYSRGWWQLRRRSARQARQYQRTVRSRWRLAVTWRLVSYWAGLFFVALALLSPIDALGQQLFFMHMIQHLLLIMIAPPLLLIANPMPFVLWGLPTTLRHKVGGLFSQALHRESTFRRWLRTLTQPGIVWMIWVISLIGWHDPGMYNAALRYEWVHNVEHLSFFIASVLLWWHLTGAGPRVHKQFGVLGRIGLVISVVPPNMITGIVLSFAEQGYYSYYEAVPRLWGIDVLMDQQLGGLIMWVPGSMMYIVAALILIGRLLSQEDRKPVRSVSEWSAAQVAAPGLEKP